MPIVSEISSCPAYTSSPEESVTLQCEITGFFPPEISVTWWEDSEQEIMEGTDSWGPLLTNGSTYRVAATLRIGQHETKVEKSERDIVCRVMHCSLQEPIQKHWRQRHIGDRFLMFLQNVILILFNYDITHHIIMTISLYL